MKVFSVVAAALFTVSPAFAQDAKPPEGLKILLITGGCCHDYAKQKDILKKGIEERLNAKVTQVHTSDGGTAPPPLALLADPKFGTKWDVVIHDECASDIKDPATIEAILAPHRAGIPGVNLHCAMHSYRIGDPNKKADAGSQRALWFDYLGVQSSRHGAQLPITVTVDDEANPITKSIIGWVTVREELYNNVQILAAKSLARGKQGAGDKQGENDAVVVWTNEYSDKKTRVFSTTLGHNNATVEDPRYLDLVSNGILWATDKLGNAAYTKAAAFGKTP